MTHSARRRRAHVARASRSLAATVLLMAAVGASGCAAESGSDASSTPPPSESAGTTSAASSASEGTSSESASAGASESPSSGSAASSGSTGPSSSTPAGSPAAAVELPANERLLAMRDAFAEIAGVQGDVAIDSIGTGERAALASAAAEDVEAMAETNPYPAVDEQCRTAIADAYTASSEVDGTAVVYDGSRAAQASADATLLPGPDTHLQVETYADEAAADAVRQAQEAQAEACAANPDFAALVSEQTLTVDGVEHLVTTSTDTTGATGGTSGHTVTRQDGSRLITLVLSDANGIALTADEAAQTASRLADAVTEEFGAPAA